MTKIKEAELLNWNCCKYCDVGGMMQDWLRRRLKDALIPSTDDIRWKDDTYHRNGIYFIKHLWSCTWDMKELPKNLENNKKLNTTNQVFINNSEYLKINKDQIIDDLYNHVLKH